MTSRQAQSGSVLAFTLVGLVAVGVLATLAYGTYFQIARGTQETTMKTYSSSLLQQAVYTLAAESGDSDADGITEPVAGIVAHSTGDGWNIPSTSGAPKSDAWASLLKYCAWDNGSIASSSGRLPGVSMALPSSIQLAVLSAGPDRVFSTTCSQAATNVVNGDDGMRSLTLAQMNLGVGGTFYYADPVSSVSALPSSGASQPGVMRIAKDTQIPYMWNGSAWLPMNSVASNLGVTHNGSCAAYPVGTLGRDSGDVLYMCSSAHVWRKIG